MKKTSPDSQSYLDRIRSWASTKAHGPSPLSQSSSRPPTLPLTNPLRTDTPQQTGTTPTPTPARNDPTNIPPFPSTDLNGLARQSSKPTANNVADDTSTDNPPPAAPPQVDGEGAVIEEEQPKKNVATRFWLTAKSIILSSYINVLLVFVPVGIASKAANLQPGVIFGMNAIAIIPLAGLLSHATESVAKRMGDTVGALMNVTFGNAVELIILYVAFLKFSLTFANPSQHVCLPHKRSRQERARSPLKGIIISIASHIIRPSPLFP
jgi:Ca2+:H+ antiporter